MGIGNFEEQIYEFTESSSLNDKQISYIAAGEEYTIFLSVRGEVYGSGLNNVHQLGSSVLQAHDTPILISSEHNIQDVVCTKGSVLAVNEKGKVYVWG